MRSKKRKYNRAGSAIWGWCEPIQKRSYWELF